MSCPWSLVAVHWTDAFDSKNGWVDISEYHPEAAHVVSVGFLYPDALKGYVSITTSYMPDEVPDLETVGMVTHIPEGMVNKVVMLGEPNWSELLT
jgi:hypothetical protein